MADTETQTAMTEANAANGATDAPPAKRERAAKAKANAANGATDAPPAKRERAAKAKGERIIWTAVRVTFATLGEFLGELSRRSAEIEGGTVRATVRLEPPGANVGSQSVTCIAGAIVAGQVLEVVEVIGMDWHTGSEADEETRKRRESWQRELDEVCAGELWELRGGRFGAL